MHAALNVKVICFGYCARAWLIMYCARPDRENVTLPSSRLMPTRPSLPCRTVPLVTYSASVGSGTPSCSGGRQRMQAG